MTQRSLFLISVVLTTLLGACASSPTQPDLDVEIPKDAPVPETPATTDAAAKAEPTPDSDAKSIPTSAVLDWQQFFKPPPSAAEVSRIKTKLEKWTNTGTVPELIQKAQNLQVVGKMHQAEVSLLEALRLEPDHRDALLELAMLYVREKNQESTFEILTYLHKRLANVEDVPRSFLFRYKYVLAIAYINHLHFSKGHDILSDLIDIDKSFAPGYSALASSYIVQGKVEMAEFVTQRGIDRGLKDPALYNLMGIIAEKKLQSETAERWYEDALAAQPDFVPVLINKARMHIKRFEFDSAESLLGKAISREPTNNTAYTMLGIAQQRLGKAKDARMSLDRAIDLDPNDAEARFNLGILLLNEFNQPDEALRAFHEVVQTADVRPELRDISNEYIEDLRVMKNN